jgi:hypothetical protein
MSGTAQSKSNGARLTSVFHTLFKTRFSTFLASGTESVGRVRAFKSEFYICFHDYIKNKTKKK